MLVVIVALR